MNRSQKWLGPGNPRWNGGTYTTSAGYVFRKSPDHPNADVRGYIREHVLVMSQHLGRPLEPNEVVHHINGNPSDNRVENLVIMTREAHAAHHHRGIRKPGSIAALKPRPENMSPMTSEKAKRMWATTRLKDRAKPKTCAHCGEEFYRKGTKPKFCSQVCYHAHRLTH